MICTSMSFGTIRNSFTESVKEVLISLYEEQKYLEDRKPRVRLLQLFDIKDL